MASQSEDASVLNSPIGYSSLAAETAFPHRPKLIVDLRFLQERSGFHALTTEDVHDVFLKSDNQPRAGTALPELLQGGHFRRAAEASVIELLQCSPNDAERIFYLLYTRLASLVLINRSDLAAHEAGALTDYLARSPPGARDVLPLIPWELRLLLVRLQSTAANDGGRRAIMALYALTAETRSHIRDARESGDQQEQSIWSERLRELGLRVGDTLAEMGELETASRHLDTLVDVKGDEIAFRKALLRLRIGDVHGAKQNIDSIENATHRTALEALLAFSNGKIPEAVSLCQTQVDNDSSNPLFATNLAVGLLYTGRITEARDLFESIAQTQPAFPGLLFNLATVYELCTDHARERKTDLAHGMASKTPAAASGGWERANFEFKL